jgi:hypothetical protein
MISPAISRHTTSCRALPVQTSIPSTVATRPAIHRRPRAVEGFSMRSTTHKRSSQCMLSLLSSSPQMAVVRSVCVGMTEHRVGDGRSDVRMAAHALMPFVLAEHPRII